MWPMLVAGKAKEEAKMISVDVAELREELNKLLARVRDEGAIVEVTVQGEAVARLVPTPRTVRSPEEIDKLLEELDEFALEIAAHWQGDMDAVAAVREQRRDL
jgi:prevent-host-death family protein